MQSDIGESIVGCYLRHIEGCDLVLYNEFTGQGQGEIDVIGLKVQTSQAWLCEVTTHIGGLQYGSFDDTTKKLTAKIKNAARYAESMFSDHEHHFQIWSPYVAIGKLTRWMDAAAERYSDEQLDVTFVINEEYTEKVQDLVNAARGDSGTTGEPAFRMLQILTRLRGSISI